MKFYFSGVNQHQWLEAMRGQLILESFADIRSLTDRYRGVWAGGMLDSGAFTEMNTGRPIDLDQYTEFAVQHGGFYDSIVNLDDIRGDTGRSMRNLMHLIDNGVDVMPVFHQGEPWSVLEDMVQDFGYVGVGFQRPIRNAQGFLDGVFARSAGVKIHGFAMTSYVAMYPFFSVDSTSWLWEVKALMAIKTQGSPMSYLTPSELVQIVIKRYQRMKTADTWKGKASSQGELFEVKE